MPGTRLVGGRELRQLCEHNGTEATLAHLTEALANRDLRPEDFSIRELAEAFMGPEWVQGLHPKHGRQYRRAELTEADAVRYSDFSGITGQIAFSAIMAGYEDEAFVFSKEVPIVQSDIQDMEKIPGMSNIGDEAQVVTEGNEFGQTGFSEDYIEIAAKAKRGMMVGITKEAIFGDRTGLILDRARRIGFYQGLNLEKRVIDAYIDENGGAKSAALGGHRYHWKGTSYATHQTSTPWVNVVTTNGLVDWTDVEGALLKFSAMTDPYTGEPILIMPKEIVVTPQNLFTALRIVNATEVRVTTPGFATSANPNQTTAPNPVRGFKVLSSAMVAARAATDTDWWLSDIKKLLQRTVNWETVTEEAGPNDPDNFNRDIVMKVKVSGKDIVSVVEPRAQVESRA